MSTDDLPQQPGPRPGSGAPPPDPATASADSSTTESGPGPTSPPRRGGDGFFDSIRRLGVARSEDRWVGGVAGGVAERFGLDPLLVRGLLILSFFLTGAGIVVYAIAWALLPERHNGRIHLQQAFRGDFDVALLGAVVAMVVGFAWNDGLWSWGFGIFDWVGGLLWIAVWVAIVWLVVKLIRDRGSRQPAAPPTWDSPTPPAPGWGTAPSGFGPTSTGPAHTESGSAPFTPAPPAPYVTGPAPTTSWPAHTTGQATEQATERQRAREAERAARQSERVARAAARRGPGAGTVGVVIGLSLLAGALLLVLERVGDVDVALLPTWLGVSAVILGLGIVVSGLRGRRGGGLSWLAVLAVVAGIALWPFGNDDDVWDVWDDPGSTSAAVVLGDGTLTPQTIEEAEDGVRVRFGSAVVDLTDLDLSGVAPGDPVVVPISTTAGSTVVRIPEGEAVTADIDVIAGNATWDVDGDTRSTNTATSGPARYSTDAARDGGARLLLDADVRTGSMTIEESR